VNNGFGVVTIETGGGGTGSGIGAVVEDTFPELGGTLNAAGFSIINGQTYQAAAITGTIGQFGTTVSAQSLDAHTGNIITLAGTDANFTTITGTTIQSGGTVSAQNGAFSNSLTVSGLPVQPYRFVKKNFTRQMFVSNKTSENLLISETIPAGALGSDRTIKFTAYGNFLDNTTGPDLTISIKYGGVNFWSNELLFVNDPDLRTWRLEGELSNVGSASEQRLGGLLFFGAPIAQVAGASGTGSFVVLATAVAAVTVGSGTVNSTVNQSFDVAATFAATGAGTYIERLYSTVEVV